MAGMMKMKRRFPDDEERDEAVDAEVEDEHADPHVPDEEGDDGGVFTEETADTEEEVGERMAAPAAGGAVSADRFVKNGMRLLYNEEGLPGVLQTLEGDGNPAEGLAMTLVTVVGRLMDSAEKAGKVLPPDVVLGGAAKLIDEIADFSAQSGGHEFAPQEKEGALRVFIGLQRDRNKAAPQGPPENAPVGAISQPPAPRGLLG